MFSPPKLITIIASLIATMAFSTICEAQQSEYERRLAAMQNARQRAQTNQHVDRQVRPATAQSDVEFAAPPAPPARDYHSAPQRVAQNNRVRNRAPQRTARVQTTQRTSNQPSKRPVISPASSQRFSSQAQQASNRIVSRNLAPAGRTAQVFEGEIISGGAPIVSGPIGAPGCTSCASGGAYETVVDGGYVDGGSCGGCDSGCGSCETYFDDPCCGRGGCPPGPCWITGFGDILYRGEYFAGAQAFQNALWTQPGTNNLVGDCSFGFNEGVNFGIPLCQLTCGILSAQVGARAVQSNFNGNDFSVEQRDQVFFTGGFYRRVDYGIQAGVVADVLYETWFTETETVQLRTDIGWVYPGGSTFGFRYAKNLQDDFTSGSIGGANFNNLQTLSEDYYRFYFRKDGCAGGWGEAYAGWTDSNQTIFGVDFDLPVTNSLAIQSTATYYLNDDPVPTNSGRLGGNLGDAWNIGVGLVWRPCGRQAYKSYDRPLFNVADNGSMLIKRQ